MQKPTNLNDLNPTPWENAMSAATGKVPSFFRVPRDNPAVLTQEQREVMANLVSSKSVANKLFKRGNVK